MLSVTAKPFHPTHGTEVNSVIYNDGIPSFTFHGSDSEFLHSITDEAIDEAFPPTAQEAAELEAVEIFVEMMATLSRLEEREEKTRLSEDHDGLGKKRWAARRELKGKPRPAKHSVSKSMHGRRPRKEEKATDLIAFDESSSNGALRELRMRQREMSRMEKLVTSNNHNSKMNNNPHQKKKPIQQPRKFS